MRIIDVGFGYDDTSSGAHHLDREIHVEYSHEVGKFPPPLAAVLVALSQINLYAPDGYEVVVAVATATATKDGPYYFSGGSANQIEVKAGALIFGSNHIQLWMRDTERRPYAYLGALFHEKIVAWALEGKMDELKPYVQEQITGTLVRLQTKKREEVDEYYQGLGPLIESERIIAHQLVLAERM